MDIVLKGVKVHNVKNVDLTLKPNQLIVFTGVSGSGKSSLAFDTIYVEGQRRYVESLSTYARRQLGEMPKPDAESITGVSPTIAIEQKTAGKNPRSTVGTMTGIYDFMRVLYARIGTPHCPVSGDPVAPQSTVQILHKIYKQFEGVKVILLSSYAKGKKGAFKDDFIELQRKGYTRIRLDGKLVELAEEIEVDKTVAHDIDLVIDRITVNEESKSRLAEGVSQGLESGKGLMSVLNVDTGEEELYSQHAFSVKSGISYGPLDPHDFSFNHPLGMCPTCQGLGRIQEFRLDLVIDPELSIAQDCCMIASSYNTVRYGNIFNNLAKLYDFKVTTPWKKLSEQAKHVFLYGVEKKWTKMRFVHPTKGSSWTEFVQWRGVIQEARFRYEQSTSDIYKNKMHELMEEMVCPVCHGARIRPYPAATLVGKRTIAALTSMPIRECLTFFQTLKLSEEQEIIADQLLKELVRRLKFLENVGVHYLTLNRTAPTLSGGEAQRVRLASQIGSGLVSTTYILDEPSIGLHPRDNIKLLTTLKALRDRGNTVIVVEHDEETIREADTVIDVGPLAGQKGGEIIVQGTLQDLLDSPKSLTGAYLSRRQTIPIPKKRRPISKDKELVIEKASHHNLKQATAKFPLGIFIAVTGVSGSGKSSLITDTLYPALSNQLMASKLPVGKHKKITGLAAIDKVIAIDQAPIGRTPRSNPSTYIKLFDEIRDLFAQLPESIAAGYKSGRFSFNVKEGSCPHCSGMGMIEIDMDFMADEWVQCQHCKGRRFDEKTLQVKFRGKNIYEVLEMTVLEAREFFSALPKIKEKLDVLLGVGLDYIRIGQPSPSLSGGEAQRIKLAKELSRPATGKTFYILDEPTTGLHFHDINKLVSVLQTLVDRGNTVLVIEHNMDLIKTADWIIDLGPEAGDEGGEIVAEGTPEKIAKMKTPTGVALAHVLHPPKLIADQKKKTVVEPIQEIIVEGASQNNLKMVNAVIPRGKITLCTGPSGSGKSSFAFETVYAEGQRRYIEAMSLYARRLIQQMPKPKVENIEGLSASIAIEQKNHAGNPRSTLGTITEAYDYLRLLYAHLGQPYSPETGEKIQTISKEFVFQKLMALPANTPVKILSPVALRKSEPFEELKERLQKEGYLRIRINREYFELDGEVPFDKQKKNELFLVIDRLMIKPDTEKRLFDAIDQAVTLSGGTLIAALDKEDLFFNLAFADPTTGKSYPAIGPHSFSFNTQQGMCLECTGLGFQYGANLAEDKELMELTPLKCVALLWKEKVSKRALECFIALMEEEEINPKKPLNQLDSDKLQIFLNGSKEEVSLKKIGLKMRWMGINSALAKIAKIGHSTVREPLIPLLHEISCISCQGSRLNPLARNVRIGKLSIADLCDLPIDAASEFLTSIALPKKGMQFLEETFAQLDKRLHFLKAIGLGYLSLGRSAPTLSGGEMQRTHLARQLGGGLTGCLYVLDEPTIGLHPHNNALLNKALRQLCDMGNTLLLVEHDPMTVAIADYILDFGPKAGKEGGQISARGTLKEIKKNPDSLTGAYLSGRKHVPYPNTRRTSKEHLTIANANLHNLKNITVSFPIKALSCITGVSGSGKSTLMNDLLHSAIKQGFKKETIIPGAKILGLDHFDKVLKLDQNPIGQTNRADVSTYADLLTPLRTLFASMPLAKTKGLQPKNFSFNHRKGMCKTCQGLGTRTILLQFLPPVKVVCETCQGFRLNPISLEVTVKGKHLGHLLDMTVNEAREWIIPIPKVIRILDTLIAVGLGYLKLSQEIATLSGGEAQRLRLSRELSKRSTGKTLYLFDEPTVGLHSEDILKLMTIFHALVKQGNTLLVIEHNLDVIANADFIADLGPDAGEKGGELIASGTPEEIAKSKTSRTAPYLKEHLKLHSVNHKSINAETLSRQDAKE
jgi:excinuclease ABC subunit A